MRGRPSKLNDGDKLEMRFQREAGISIDRIRSMWGLSRRRVLEILAELRAKLGPEKFSAHRRQFVRAPKCGNSVLTSESEST